MTDPRVLLTLLPFLCCCSCRSITNSRVLTYRQLCKGRRAGWCRRCWTWTPWTSGNGPWLVPQKAVFGADETNVFAPFLDDDEMDLLGRISRLWSWSGVRPVCLSSPCVVLLVPGMKQARAGQSLNRKIQLSWEYQWSFDAFVQFRSGSGGGFDGRGGHWWRCGCWSCSSFNGSGESSLKSPGL